jgi:hypothetical protein
MCNLRFPKKRPMSAPKITVAMIAAPCAPSACHGVENGHAMRQPALIARPAPAPYRAPATVRTIRVTQRSITCAETALLVTTLNPISANPAIPAEEKSVSDAKTLLLEGLNAEAQIQRVAGPNEPDARLSY